MFPGMGGLGGPGGHPHGAPPGAPAEVGPTAST